MLADYAKPTPTPAVTPSILMLPIELLNRVLLRDTPPSMECQTLLGPTLQVPQLPHPPVPPVVLDYTTSHIESARTNLEYFVKQVREYMVDQGKWVKCTQPSAPSTLPQDMPHSGTKSKAIGVLVMQTIADLLTSILEHTGKRKGSS